MLTADIISIVLIGVPLIAALPPITGVFDLNYGDSKKQFQEKGKVVKDKKIEAWRKVFLGANADGFNDEYVITVLRDMAEGKNLSRTLKFCKGCFNFYYLSLYLIIALGVVHGFLSLFALSPNLLLFINSYKVLIIAGTLLYIIGGLGGLFFLKWRLEKKYEKYIELF